MNRHRNVSFFLLKFLKEFILYMKAGFIMKKEINNNLKTPEYLLLDKECPLKEYPRMQFKRDSYFSLNGEWDYIINYF